ncbi:hypothetical protein [Sphingomonas sp.]|uniref:hypothetical protein n=1 Tax=Sphingomonas sp. TaxID=28214 RepID=UPI0035B46FA8
MRDFSRRLAALEMQPSNRGFRQVVIVAQGQPAPPDSDDIHIIRIAGVERDANGDWVLARDGRDPLPAPGSEY